jgi:alpha-glucosidase
VVDAYGDRVLIGETTNIRYHGNGQNELHMVFNFPLTRSSQMSPPAVRANQRARLAALPPGAWPCNTNGNHDTSRIGSVLSDGQHDRRKHALPPP